MAGAWKTYKPAGSSRRPYRFVYTAMVNVLAATLCSWVSHGGEGPLVVAAAGVLWMVTTWGATVLAVAAAGNLRRPALLTLLDPRAHALVLATVVLAVGEYYASRLTLPGLALSVPAAIGVQRFFARAELRALDAQEAAERLRAQQAQEVVDNLMTQASWVWVAEILVPTYPCFLIRIEAAPNLENLAEAVRAVTDVQLGNELVGRYGPTGIAVMVPGPQAAAMALRLAAALATRGVVSCQVASASSRPSDGLTVHDQLAICEAELVVRGQAAESEHDRH